MVDERLLNYIQRQRGRGISDDKIRQALSGSGWSEEDINGAFNEAEPTSPPMPEERAQKILSESSSPSNSGTLYEIKQIEKVITKPSLSMPAIVVPIFAFIIAFGLVVGISTVMKMPVRGDTIMGAFPIASMIQGGPQTKMMQGMMTASLGFASSMLPNFSFPAAADRIPGLIGVSNAGMLFRPAFDSFGESHLRDDMKMALLIGLVLMLIFAALGVLAVMAIVKSLYEQKYGFSQFFSVMGGSSILFAFLFPIVVFYLGSYIKGGIGFLISFAVGCLFALALPYVALGSGIGTAFGKAIKKIKNVPLVVGVLFFVYGSAALTDLVFNGIILSIIKDLIKAGSTLTIVSFVLVSIATMVIIAFQGVALNAVVGQKA